MPSLQFFIIFLHNILRSIIAFFENMKNYLTSSYQTLNEKFYTVFLGTDVPHPMLSLLDVEVAAHISRVSARSQ